MIKIRKMRDAIKEARQKEIVSFLFILAFLAAALYSVFISPQLYQRDVHEGDIALRNVYAPYDFSYFWGIDEERMEKAKQAVIQKAPYFFQRNSQLEEKAIFALEDFFDILDAEKENESPLAEKIEVLNKKLKVKVSEKNLKYLLEYPDTLALKAKSAEIIKRIFLAGCVSDEDLVYLKKENANLIVVVDEEASSSSEKKVEELLDKTKIQSDTSDCIPEQFEGNRRLKQAVTAVISEYAVPNIKIDQKRTGEERDIAVKKVEPAYLSWQVEKNELIIEKGKRVNARHLAQITKLRRIFKPGTTPTFFIGILLLFLLLGLISVIYISFIRKTNFLQNTKEIAIILLNMFFIILISDFITRSPQPSYFIPMAGMGMLIMLLVGANMAFLSVVVISLLISLLVGGGIEVMLVLLTGSMVGIFAVRDTRRRANILWAGLLAGVAKFTAIVCIGLINQIEAEHYIRDGIWGVASGLFSGFMVMGLLPAFEYFFKVPTNISLLELSDLNHPLLKELAIEAPGTYHHSIMVGNLAEAACNAIGANSLQARVGAYFHDIGKIPKAEYFSENEMGAPSRHSKLTPSMSALIISKHVKDGVDIAKKHKLHTLIIDFITQHHGDGLISYFYQKAMEKAGNDVSVKEEDFRYEGPKPQTKESAIILLADSVEASSRALDDPTPSSIRNLVKKIINNKFIDGQLDDCALTLKEMYKIAESFVRVLIGTFHTRLDYPETSLKSQDRRAGNDGKGKYQKPKQQKKN
ncbi:MAG: HDIG domain-containing metalloprotein [Candidatus Omnitrophota bacterium]